MTSISALWDSIKEKYFRHKYSGKSLNPKLRTNNSIVFLTMLDIHGRYREVLGCYGGHGDNIAQATYDALIALYHGEKRRFDPVRKGAVKISDISYEITDIHLDRKYPVEWEQWERDLTQNPGTLAMKIVSDSKSAFYIPSMAFTFNPKELYMALREKARIIPGEKHTYYLIPADDYVDENYIEAEKKHHSRRIKGGSWYPQDPDVRNSQIKKWIENNPPIIKDIRAVIVPHAGYEYSGEIAAAGYAHLTDIQEKRIFLLGPAHNSSENACYLSEKNNLGGISIDTPTVEFLKKNVPFIKDSSLIENIEHSIDNQLPFLSFLAASQIIPIWVGNLESNRQKIMGEFLAPYIKDPQNIFIISTDFCHWGKRFGFSSYDRYENPNQFIESLDA